MVKTKAKLHPRGDVADEVLQCVDEALTACWKELLKKKHELFDEVPWKVGLQYFRGRTNVAVYGGHGGSVAYDQHRNGIHISLRPQSYNWFSFNEYASFAKDSVIGSVLKNESSYRKRVFALVAHELSHWYVSRYSSYCPWLKSRRTKNDRRGHGTKFQDVYRILRANVVNPME